METSEKTREKNKALVRQFFEYFAAGESDKIESELWASGYQLHFPGRKEPRDSEESKELLKVYSAGFPDLMVSIEDQIAEGDYVVTRMVFGGKHEGKFQDLEPTHKHVTITGIATHYIVDGKIAEEWVQFDSLGLMQQLGVVPEEAHAELH